jgi:hypothetical protein
LIGILLKQQSNIGFAHPLIRNGHSKLLAPGYRSTGPIQLRPTKNRNEEKCYEETAFQMLFALIKVESHAKVGNNPKLSSSKMHLAFNIFAA